MKSIQEIQAENASWVQANFPHHNTDHPLLGVIEEVGELCHAVLKRKQNIRTEEDHIEKERDAIGDIVIFLMDYCTCRGYDLTTVVNEVWEKVRLRDWRKDPSG